jgi:hypothetical protein
MAERCEDREGNELDKQMAVEGLKAELAAAFAVPDGAHVLLTVVELVRRYRRLADQKDAQVFA